MEEFPSIDVPNLCKLTISLASLYVAFAQFDDGFVIFGFCVMNNILCSLIHFWLMYISVAC